ncbi:hypothetical protein [Kitasatospora sp. GAS204B]|uniref:COG4315 family predicted lipoprotein n=1 Tax=unclassified Kitasatospora TaxID=2633591 RepID=UPI0024768C1B|nr:hypothetical protein [Kitasatospora sp. GAS204B]
MKRGIALALGATAVAALAAGCGSSTSKTATPSATPSPSASAPSSGTPATGAATLKVASSPLGQVLVDGAGRTLYLFQADTGTTSNCNGACAMAWPPNITTGQPNSNGVNASLVGTTTRMDHSTQVTYKGHPLYYFAEDTKPGQTNGEGVNAFGGAWYVVSPSGDAITSAPSMQSPAPSTGGGY